MRVLFVVPYAPNPVRVRPYEFIRALAKRGNLVMVATLWTSPAEQEDLAKLKAMGVQVLAQPMPSWRSAANSAGVLPSSTPLQAVYSWQPALLDDMLAALRGERYDAIHVEHLRGSRYGLELLHRLGSRDQRPPVVWDSVDCISHLFAQAAQASRSRKSKLITSFELPRTQRYEARLVGAFDHTVVTSPVDKAALAELARRFPAKGEPGGAQAPGQLAPGQLAPGQLAPGQQAAGQQAAGQQAAGQQAAGQQAAGQQAPEQQIDVVPNGVDLEHFAYCGPAGRNPNRIVFSGKMSYHANVTAALHLVQDIMPQVWAQAPDAEVWIVGKDPTPELRALGDAPSAGKARVVVTGEVPAMEPYIQQAAIAAAPLLYGAGIQNKVLEALACGTPTVASRQASQALTAAAGRDYLVADTDADFAAAIVGLLRSAERRAELGRCGRQFVEQHHSWDSAVRRLESIYAACDQRAQPEYAK